MKYVVSYAYDVPHYADFTVEARNEKDALRKAKKALRAGKFTDILGQSDESAHAHRVFVMRRCGEHDQHLDPIPAD